MKKASGTPPAPPMREAVLAYARERYGTAPDWPWVGDENDFVLRHADSKKWYALFMCVPEKRLGLRGSGDAALLNVKCDPILGGSLRREKGILPAYHMHRDSWLTALLDGSVPLDTLKLLLDASYALTEAKPRAARAKAGAQRITQWLAPANPRYYDLEQAFAQSDTILWKQSSSVRPGDTVYLYVAAPVSAIRYRCVAVETDIPFTFEDEHVRMKRGMRLRLLQRYDGVPLDRALLKKHGVTTVRGPRSMPEGLLRALRALYPE